METFNEILQKELKSGAIRLSTYFDILIEKELNWEREFTFKEPFSFHVKENKKFTAKDVFRGLIEMEKNEKEKKQINKYRMKLFKKLFKCRK